MVVKEPFTIDLFDGEYFGAWTGETVKTERGQKPKIRIMGFTFFKSLMPFLNSTEPFNYEIDPDKNVKTIETDIGLTFKVLVPTEDVPKCHYESTIFAKILRFVEKLKTTNSQRIRELKKENKRLEKELDQLKEEREEREKHESSRSSKPVDCPTCGNSYTPQKWTAEDGECPNCGNNHPKYSD